MDKERDILKQWDNLSSIEPSAAWELGLRQKLNRFKEVQNEKFNTKLIWGIAAIFLIANVLSSAKSWQSAHEKENNSKLAYISSAILIN